MIMSWVANFLVGSITLALSVYGTTRPRKIATFFERVDAIGSKRRSRSVEPADWNVRVLQILFAFMSLASGVFVALMLASPS